MLDDLWDQLPGQAHAQRVLKAHIGSGRVSHGYLFSGTDIGGLEKLARVFACCVMTPGLPDSVNACRQILEGTHPDLHLAGPSGASERIKIEDIRNLIQRTGMRPYNAAAQVVIIAHADRFTEEAGNCLLKSLEEPSGYTFFCLLSTNARNCLPTIVSRCQVVRAGGPVDRGASSRLGEHAPDPDQSLRTARLAGGDPDRAQNLQENGVLEAWTEFPHTASAWDGIELPSGREPVRWFIAAMIEWVRDIVLVKVSAPHITHAYAADMLREQAGALRLNDALALIESLTETVEGVNRYASPKVAAVVARERWLRIFNLDQTHEPGVKLA